MSSSCDFDAERFTRDAKLSGTEVLPGVLPDPAYIPRFVINADTYFERLKTEIPWKDKYWHFLYKLPQQVYHYTTSERDKNTNSLLEELIWLVEHFHNARASEVWCNLYRDGRDHIRFHQDQYGEHLTTLSFGVTRTLLLRHLETRRVCRFRLGQGDLYTWSPATDKLFEHAIPRTDSIEGVRISIVVWTTPPGTGR